MTQTQKIPLLDFVLCLSEAVDLISAEVADHHKRTAQICYGLGRRIGLPDEELRDLVIAAALHDVGGLTRADRLSALEFEYQNPYGHSVMGYLLLRPFIPFSRIANIVRFHHVTWNDGVGRTFAGEEVPMLSHLLQLADRVAILIDPTTDVLIQVDGILEKIQAQMGTRFVPEYVNALLEMRTLEYFWLDSIYMKDLATLGRKLDFNEIALDDEEFFGLTNIFRRIIDFRSPFTATHSAGVSAVAGKLGELIGFSAQDRNVIILAGLLHDLGKLAVPSEILEKPGRLTEEEFDIVKRHTYYTYHLLEPLKIMDVIRQWGAFHHERLNGKGYPFHVTEIDMPMGSRVVAVADVFTALTEDRPYRKGLPLTDAYQIIWEMVAQKNLDPSVAQVLGENLEMVDLARVNAQDAAVREYQDFNMLAKQLTHEEE